MVVAFPEEASAFHHLAAFPAGASAFRLVLVAFPAGALAFRLARLAAFPAGALACLLAVVAFPAEAWAFLAAIAFQETFGSRLFLAARAYSQDRLEFAQGSCPSQEAAVAAVAAKNLRELGRLVDVEAAAAFRPEEHSAEVEELRLASSSCLEAPSSYQEVEFAFRLRSL